MMAIVHRMPAMAQNMSYGADNFYRSDNVTVQPTTFQSQYQTAIAGNIFTLNNLNRSAETPAIIVGHPMGAVKEQSANLYATKLAEQGFITVSLDLPFWGGSDGDPRNAVSPDLYAEAFSAAVDYLGGLEFVNREQIGALGICGSGSFVISAKPPSPRQRGSVGLRLMAARFSTQVAPRITLLKSRLRSTVSSSTFTVPRVPNSRLTARRRSSPRIQRSPVTRSS